MEETKKDPRAKQKRIAILAETGILVLIYALLYYLAHPALSIKSMGLWVYAMSFIALWAVCREAFLYLVNDSTPYDIPEWLKKETNRTHRLWLVLLSVIAIFFLACGFGSRILFITNPIDIDHGLDIGEIVKMIERDYAGQSILVKPHPRDTYQYRSDIVKFETISTETPAELILYCLLASGKIPEVIYDYPTSAAMHTGVKGKLYRLPSDNRQYNDLMDRYSRQISSIQQTKFIRKTA